MKILCNKDFLMFDSEVSFVAGKEYLVTSFDNEMICLIDEQGDEHYMELDDINLMVGE